MLSGQGTEEDCVVEKSSTGFILCTFTGGKKVKSHAQTDQHVKHLPPSLSLSTDIHNQAA